MKIIIVSSLCILIAGIASAMNSCKIDSVCFAIDMSSSISPTEYKTQIKAVGTIARTLPTAPGTTSFSAHGFASSTRLVSAPTTNLASFISSANTVAQLGGGTTISKGLSACYNTIRTSSGNRVIVLLTDGYDGGNARGIATTIKNAGIDIITIGIGRSISEPYLKSLASTPRFFARTLFRNIMSETTRIANKICEAGNQPKPSAACQSAYWNCEFRIDGASNVPTMALGMQDKALTAKIVSLFRTERVGVVNANGGPAEFIMDDGSAMPITKFGSQRFSPSTFKPYTLRGDVSFSGIGHQTLQSDQAKVASGKCVRIFITSYQELEPAADGYVIGNKNIGKNPRKCVVVFLR